MTPDEELAFAEMAKTVLQSKNELNALVAMLSGLIGMLRARKTLSNDEIEAMLGFIEDCLPPESRKAYQDVLPYVVITSQRVLESAGPVRLRARRKSR